MRVLASLIVKFGTGEVVFDYGRSDNSTSPRLLPLGADFELLLGNNELEKIVFRWVLSGKLGL